MQGDAPQQGFHDRSAIALDYTVVSGLPALHERDRLLPKRLAQGFIHNTQKRRLITTDQHEKDDCLEDVT